jgi:hypothetical protein
MTPERFEEILKNNGFETVECYDNKDYIRKIYLSLDGGALSEGLKIVFIESETSKTPIMEFETFDSETVGVKPEVTEAIAYCISNFETVWNYFNEKGDTK